MIISDKHRYLFIEVPRTGSTAISKELSERYDGRPILHKHAHYNEFLRVANDHQKSYLVFQGKRNPLDDVVSRYFKLKNNHKGDFTNPQLFRSSGGWIKQKHLKQFEFVQKNNADFSAYFQRYYKVQYLNLRVPYFSPYDWPGRHISKIIRFENLETEFESAIKAIGLQPQRSLPIENKTKRRDQDFYQYYSFDLRRRAISIFGPYMRKWGYNLPDDWGGISIPMVSQWKFKLIENLGVACFRMGVVPG
jgi:hypothetical protein